MDRRRRFFSSAVEGENAELPLFSIPRVLSKPGSTPAPLPALSRLSSDRAENWLERRVICIARNLLTIYSAPGPTTNRASSGRLVLKKIQETGGGT